ncbi:uncharacterized protein BT62DRAFT_926229 [Guyanagaster necrorhizus]|uniref:Uncharacterized protein n=1 Tax=Guyanagaster necrorhizus TaxID=856835 RepID=A0A9P8AXP7_9AGAR|nr:uncharacterized protein BT62DRAFT_926229 [Guyanagaster necrorhizus MCA 3950]KAG7452014.1 hypothetical protein BT62DRAFT_926229 [Guyanagaster necrorhizus MCA 3950]
MYLALLASLSELRVVRALLSQGDLAQQSNTVKNVVLMEVRDRPAKHIDLSLLAVVSLILPSAMVLVIYYYVSSRCNKIRRARNRQQKETSAPTKDTLSDPGPGFGFDGLSKSELEELRLKEEAESTSMLVKIPNNPPELSLTHFQSLPSLTLRFNNKKEVEVEM